MSIDRGKAPASVGEYLAQLRAVLAGQDPALVQDAVYDAQEYLRAELGEAPAGADIGERMAEVIASYGTPQEVGRAYVEADARLGVDLPPVARSSGSPLQRFFSVMIDPRAYSALLFNLLGLITGIGYFTWAATGTALSLGLSVLIFGLPFALLFLATLRALALAEGRLVESMLGVRMPRRPELGAPARGIWERIRHWLSDGRTWSTLAYLFLKLPLGILSFTVFTVLICLSAGLMATPVVQALGFPVAIFGSYELYWPLWALWMPVATGALLLVTTLHLARLAGAGQGRLAKVMLVR